VQPRMRRYSPHHRVVHGASLACRQPFSNRLSECFRRFQNVLWVGARYRTPLWRRDGRPRNPIVLSVERNSGVVVAHVDNLAPMAARMARWWLSNSCCNSKRTKVVPLQKIDLPGCRGCAGASGCSESPGGPHTHWKRRHSQVYPSFPGTARNLIAMANLSSKRADRSGRAVGSDPGAPY
jgi:hypothetical protein